MVNAHDSQRHPALPLLPWHPVWNGAHVNGGKHRLTENPGAKQRRTGGNRLIKSHILVDCQHHTGIGAAPDDFNSLRKGCPQRFLRQDGFGKPASFKHPEDYVGLAIRRHRDVKHIDIRMSSKLFNTVTN